jgi:hypothetical protein
VGLLQAAVTAGVLLISVNSVGANRFARDVAPVLEASCLKCHGAERPRGGLRLDRADRLRAVIVPGSARRSPLVQRILGHGGDRMPAGGPPLSQAAVTRIRRWIDGGARDLVDLAPAGGHWAFTPLPPVPPPLPPVRHPGWPRNPLDHFILARLERAGLAPNEPAARETLLRRVSLDLTGLPPTPAEIDGFVADRRADAYERVVDRLLASPHFGERWAVPWLDGARYADSNGYEKDGRRSIWKYRDWVVDAFNKDLPFDRFTQLQLAGDLMPDADLGARIATGFHRNTLFNEEGGVDPAEARWERLCDRARTTASVFLGLTLGCAQCHDHKHDPLAQRDFYGLLAYFENAAEEILQLPTAAQAPQLAALRDEQTALERTLETWTPALGAAQRRWEAELEALDASFEALPFLTEEADGETRLVTGTISSELTAIRIEALPDPSLPGGGPGQGHDGNFFVTALVVESAPAAAPLRWQPVPLRAIVADDRPREEPERYAAANLLAPVAADGQPRGWGVAAVYDGPQRLPRQLLLLPARSDALTAGSRLRIRWRAGDQTGIREGIGRPRLSLTRAARPERLVDLVPALHRVRRQRDRDKAGADALAAAFRQVAPELAATRERLQAVKRSIEALGIAETLVLGPSSGPAVTPLRLQGSFLRPGEPIAAAIPARLRPQRPVAPDRLGLARWLTDRDNPLTARVLVNRIWAQYFGRGLVETVEDLGTAGARPSHPDLLDHLARTLVDGGWRLKPLHRLIVTSATYQQSSRLPARQRARIMQRDPANRLLSRAPRLRLEAEMVRDVALAASGLLQPQLGGPPVFPPQPAGVFAPPNSREPPWPTSQGDQSHRRALYTFWRRTAPYPAAALFDAPSREACVLRRGRSSTPLQALVTLNDPAFWEAAGALAGRMARVAGPLAAKVTEGFRLATGRRPDAAELGSLLQLHRRERARASASAAAESRALTLVANVIFNLDETLSKD